MKIVKLVSWIGVGAVHINKLRKEKWSFTNYTALGHGNYFNSSNGYSWSSFKDSINYKQSFTFLTEDKILLSFDPTKRILKV